MVMVYSTVNVFNATKLYNGKFCCTAEMNKHRKSIILQLKKKTRCNHFKKKMVKFYVMWTSLVAQWLRIHLPMQGTRV